MSMVNIKHIFPMFQWYVDWLLVLASADRCLMNWSLSAVYLIEMPMICIKYFFTMFQRIFDTNAGKQMS